MKKFTVRFRGWQDNRGNKIPLWKEDLELSANIRDWVEQQPHADEEDFAQFCLSNLIDNLYQFQQLLLQVVLFRNTRFKLNLLVLLLSNFWRLVLSSLAFRHLSAFLENIGYEKSKEIYFQKLKNQKNSIISLPPDDSLDQIFQYAWLEATNPIKFFRNFKEEKFDLICYAKSAMNRKIIDQIFLKKYPTITYSGYGLLRKLGEGERSRKKALELRGYKNFRISELLLTWECFYQICTPNHQGKIKPTIEDWQALARQYNQLRQEPLPVISWETAQNWIDNDCIPAVRNYLAPKLTSVDNINQNTNERNVDLSEELSPSLHDLLEQEEMNEFVKRLRSEFDFLKFISDLKLEDQILMLLRYGFEFKQVDIAEEFHWYTGNRPDNSRVSKVEDRIFRDFSKALLNWAVKSRIRSEENLVNINSKWLQKMNVKSACESLTRKHYYSIVKSIMDETKLAFKQQLSTLESNNQLADQQQLIKTYIVNQIQSNFKIILPADGHAVNKISSFLEDL